MEVLKIGAVWCSGCLVMRPRWKEIEQENSWLKTRYLDYDVDRDEVSKYVVDRERLPICVFSPKTETSFFGLTAKFQKTSFFKPLIGTVNVNFYDLSTIFSFVFIGDRNTFGWWDPSR